MAVSSAITDALLNAVQDGGAIGAGVLGLVIAVSMFKHMRRTVNADDGVEKGLFIDDRDPELLGLVEDYADARNAQVGQHESDGTYEHYYRNREAFDDIREFIEGGNGPLDAEEDHAEASPAA
ncbi:MAG: major capsid protein [Methylococcus sp.]|nr:major capsid protein [Methylococcus sp.]